MSAEDSSAIIELLQRRLHSLNDLHLTLSSGGRLSTADAKTEHAAADQAAEQARRQL
jgi:hypothetical protein